MRKAAAHNRPLLPLWLIALLLALPLSGAGVASAAIEYAPAVPSYGGFPSQGAYCATLPTNLYRAVPP